MKTRKYYDDLVIEPDRNEEDQTKYKKAVLNRLIKNGAFISDEIEKEMDAHCDWKKTFHAMTYVDKIAARVEHNKKMNKQRAMAKKKAKARKKRKQR